MSILSKIPDAYILISSEGVQYIWIPKTEENLFSENELWESVIEESRIVRFGMMNLNGISYRKLRYCNKHSHKFNLILDNFSEICSGNHSWKLVRQFKIS